MIILKSRQAAREWHLEVHRGAVHRAMGVGGTQRGATGGLDLQQS